MPARVSLSIVKGREAGQHLSFEQRTVLVVGKEKDCHLRFPKDRDHRHMSRYHCLFDINPPAVCVRDLGSRNGTRVNGQEIGRRENKDETEANASHHFPPCHLQNGDQVKVGNLVFAIEIYAPAFCSNCSQELTDKPEEKEGTVLCAQCQQILSHEQKLGVKIQATKCDECGRDLDEVDQSGSGKSICRICRADPLRVVKRLIKLAQTGMAEVTPLRDLKVVRQLGTGGMGAVFLVKHQKTSKPFALKLMLPGVAVYEHARKNFEREVICTQALKHRNVVRLYQHGCAHGAFYMLLDYCNAGNVMERMKEHGGPLPVDDAIDIILQALDGLEYAHNVEIPQVRLADGGWGKGHGLVHRDIKPQNIFLHERKGKLIAKVGDYGLSKAFDLAGLSGFTLTDVASGTPAFVPRQQLYDYLFAKPEVDVWAMAATLYYLLTETFPRDFPAKEHEWRMVLDTEPVPIRKRGASIPKRLAQVIDKALIEEPEIYFQSAAELKAALEEAAGR